MIIEYVIGSNVQSDSPIPDYTLLGRAIPEFAKVVFRCVIQISVEIMRLCHKLEEVSGYKTASAADRYLFLWL